MLLSGPEISLKEVANQASSIFVEKPFGLPRYNWTNGRHIQDGESYQLAILNNIIVHKRFALYSLETKSHISNMTYTGHLDRSYPKSYERIDDELKLNVDTPVELDEESLVFILGGQNNIYHWYFNWFPRLFVFKKLADKVGVKLSGVKVLVSESLPPNMRDMILKEGVDPENIISIRANTCAVIIKRAVVVNFFDQHCYYPEILSLYKSRRYLIDRKNARHNKRIYIDRNNLATARRRVDNINDLMSVLKKHRLSKVHLEYLTIREQATLFYSSAIIVASHGAGLANLLFCKRNTKLVLFEYKGISEYEELARLLGISCYKIPCFQVENCGVPEKRLWDFHIDAVLVDSLLSNFNIRSPSYI